MTCGKCGQYSRQLGRCVLGYVNPRTKKGTKSCIEFAGANYVCRENKWKEAIVEEIITAPRDARQAEYEQAAGIE